MFLRGILALMTLSSLGATLPVGVADAATAPTCPATTLSTPFAAWGDTNSYSLIAGGNFEGTLSGWTLSATAKQVAVSKTEAGSSNVGAWSLELPVGASVQTPLVCVSSTEHTFRFFARGLAAGATVNAQVIYGSVNGSDPGQSTTLSTTWEPSSVFHTGPLVKKALEASGTVEVALRITATKGTSKIDDLYEDPRMRK